MAASSVCEAELWEMVLCGVELEAPRLRVLSGSKLQEGPTLQFLRRETKPASNGLDQLKQDKGQAVVTCTGTGEQPRGPSTIEDPQTSGCIVSR